MPDGATAAEPAKWSVKKRDTRRAKFESTIDSKGSARVLYRWALGPLASVRLTSGLDIVSDVRAFVYAYSQKRYTKIVGERAGLAAHELLENALAFAAIGTEIEFGLSENTERETLEVQVSNAAIPSRIERLVRRLVEIRDKGPQQVYHAALHEMMTGVRSRSMLGLARLAHEGQVTLEATAADDRVTVCASVQLRPSSRKSSQTRL